jgi:hypothetical protein
MTALNSMKIRDAILDSNSGFDSVSKPELHAIADRASQGDPEAIEWCVGFMEQESRGIWHGRARAMMARRFKHVSLSVGQRSRLVRAILNRLTQGNFSEQFKDQLRLAVHLEPAVVRSVAEACLKSESAHVRRYAEWTLARRFTASTAPPSAGSSDGIINTDSDSRVH